MFDEPRDVGIEFTRPEWWNQYGDSIPAYAIPRVYDCLAQIAECADKAAPEAGIKKHFQFFAKQAPSVQS